MGFVYLLREIDQNGEEAFKIGVTKNNVDSRRAALQTGNPNKIDVLKIYESINYKKIESWLHRKYCQSKTQAKNEWRTLTPEEIFEFLDECRKIDETINFMKEHNSFYK